MRTVQLDSLKQLLAETPPSLVLDSPSMMSKNEKSFLYSLAKNYYTGRGLIVDAGIFLGGSTVCFGKGLLDNFHHLSTAQQLDSKPIKSFEKASTNPGMLRFFERHGIETSILQNESFEPLLRKYIQPVSSLVDLTIGDVGDASWNHNKKIEILFLDVIKDPKINRHVFKTFMPHLIPGVSIVIQQDYFIDQLPYIIVEQEALSDYFEYIGEIQSTGLFKLVKAIPQTVLDTDPLQTLPKQKQISLIEQSIAKTVDPNRKFLVSLAKVRLVGQYFGKDQAIAAIKEIDKTYPEQVSSQAMKRLQTAYQNIIRYTDKL